MARLKRWTIALLLGRQWLEAQWTPDLKSTLAAYGVAIRLSDMSGHNRLWPDAQSGREARRAAADTRACLALASRNHDPAARWPPRNGVRTLVFASMAAITALILAGSYLIGRTVTARMALSRLQSDFRFGRLSRIPYPLTSLCLLSEQLASGRVDG